MRKKQVLGSNVSYLAKPACVPPTDVDYCCESPCLQNVNKNKIFQSTMQPQNKTKSTANQSFQSTMPSMGHSFDQIEYIWMLQSTKLKQPFGLWQLTCILCSPLSHIPYPNIQLGCSCSDQNPTTGRTSTTRTSRWLEQTPRPSHGAVPRTDRGPDRRPIKTRKASSIWTQSQPKMPTIRQRSQMSSKSHQANSSPGWTKYIKAASTIRAASKRSKNSAQLMMLNPRWYTKICWKIPKPEELRTKMIPWPNRRFSTETTSQIWMCSNSTIRQIFHYLFRYSRQRRKLCGYIRTCLTPSIQQPVAMRRICCFPALRTISHTRCG